jgi:probable HAF family extracellular repeat protein
MKNSAARLILGLAVLVCMSVSAFAQTTYTFQTLNYPNDTFTQLLGINNSGDIAGYHGANVNMGFTYSLTGKTFTNENFPGSQQTQVIGINNEPFKTSGFYVAMGKTHGFTDYQGTFKTVDFPKTHFNQLLSQNDFGQSAGYYSTRGNGSGPDHAYVYDEFGGVFELFNIPGSTSDQATGINNSDDVCGFLVDAAGVNHGWLKMLGHFTVLDFPGSTGTQALGLNNKGLVVGFYTDNAGNTHGFVYNVSAKTYQSIDDPNGPGTTIVNGINDKGMLVGFSGTAPLNNGFVATPQ